MIPIFPVEKIRKMTVSDNCAPLTYGTVTMQLCAGGLDFDVAGYEASLLIAKAANITRARVLAGRDIDYGAMPCGAVLASMVRRRASREPLQYILGEWAFMGDTYEIGAGCLIPRADTEILAEAAIARIPRGGTFADLCTGSGCVAISILRRRPDILHAVAADLSSDALAYATRNAARLGVAERLTLVQADVTRDFFDPHVRFDAVTANPPYIPAPDIDSLDPELAYEPVLALDGGADGLAVLRAIVEIYPAHLRDGGFLALEFGYDQPEQVRALLEEHGLTAELLRDYGGNIRAAVAGAARGMSKTETR